MTISTEPTVKTGTHAFNVSGTADQSAFAFVCGYVQTQSETLATAVMAFRAVGDTDSDGVYDDQDRCPNERGVDERTGQGSSRPETRPGPPAQIGRWCS